MQRIVEFENQTITYELQIKRVKNINLRIRPDGTVAVSAGKNVPKGFIDSFVLSRAKFILSAQKRCVEKANARTRYFDDSELKSFIVDFCKEIYPYYAARSIAFPDVKFRKMISRWGSCNPKKKIVTFNTNLCYAPEECVKYVVYHEFTHFLRADHSAYFYKELAKVCPEWHKYRMILKSVSIPR